MSLQDRMGLVETPYERTTKRKNIEGRFDGIKNKGYGKDGKESREEKEIKKLVNDIENYNKKVDEHENKAQENQQDLNESERKKNELQDNNLELKSQERNRWLDSLNEDGIKVLNGFLAAESQRETQHEKSKTQGEIKAIKDDKSLTDEEKKQKEAKLKHLGKLKEEEIQSDLHFLRYLLDTIQKSNNKSRYSLNEVSDQDASDKDREKAEKDAKKSGSQVGNDLARNQQDVKSNDGDIKKAEGKNKSLKSEGLSLKSNYNTLNSSLNSKLEALKNREKFGNQAKYGRSSEI